MSSHRVNARSRKRTQENTQNERPSNDVNDDSLPDNTQSYSFASSKRTKHPGKKKPGKYYA
jgi:hypothetical protein